MTASCALQEVQPQTDQKSGWCGGVEECCHSNSKSCHSRHVTLNKHFKGTFCFVDINCNLSTLLEVGTARFYKLKLKYCNRGSSQRSVLIIFSKYDVFEGEGRAVKISLPFTITTTSPSYMIPLGLVRPSGLLCRSVDKFIGTLCKCG